MAAALLPWGQWYICDCKYLTFRWGSSQQRIGPLIHCYPSVSGQTESREVRVCSSYQHWQLAELSVHKRPSQDIKEAQDKLSIHLDDNHGVITKLTGVWLCTITDSRRKLTHFTWLLKFKYFDWQSADLGSKSWLDLNTFSSTMELLPCDLHWLQQPSSTKHPSSSQPAI